MKKGKGYVIANWKMNPGTIGDAKKLFLDIKDVASRLRNVRVVIAPPVPFLAEIHNLYTGSQLEFAVQNTSSEERGSFTGEMSVEMAKSVGAEYTIVGHSERRAMGETYEEINKKVLAALAHKLTVVLCVGEKDRDSQGDYLSFLEEELGSALIGVPSASLKNILIAYEPVWAIGKKGKDAMEPRDVQETVLFLRKILAQMYDKKSAFSIRFLYGGSVEPENTEDLLQGGGVSGFLVGHASLEACSFLPILKTNSEYRFLKKK